MSLPKDNRLTPLARQLRKDATPEERHLWYDFLKTYPISFRRQVVMGRYIVDFYAHQAQLVIELDGGQHYEAEGMEKDAARTAFLEKQGLRVLRFSNLDIRQNFSGVCTAIDCAAKEG